ncbi:hemolysin III [Propioniferax innocua]|uniref:Hemolysin III n=1 Tax=Propioniferax innocua TaxID=1753 RepID=A0A542ZBY0_9ACTN|nr:hemolysin III [Propioniferax innocua]
MTGRVSIHSDGDRPQLRQKDEVSDSMPDPVLDAPPPGKPLMRGWIHAAWTPVAIVAGICLIVFAHNTAGRVGGAVFLFGSIMLFGTSAIYHRGTWSDATIAVLRRMDHANIFVFIAATYTPLALMLLEGRSRVLLLSVIWTAGVIGLLFRILWLQAPRALYTVLYLLMGWAALGWLPQFWANGGPLVFFLIIGGGLLYTIGAIAYARKRPNPSPRWFGFHEIFHACTVGAFACHYSAIALATFDSAIALATFS